jgi:uncharacterized protein (TIGR02145 family)
MIQLMNRITVIFFLLAFPLISIAQDQFNDARDNRNYRYTRLGELLWMTENLKYELPGSICYDHCDTIRFYDFRNVSQACPNGWRLPTMEEWDLFTESFTDAKKVRLMEKNVKNYRVDFLDGYNIFDNNALSIQPYGRVEGGSIVGGNFIDFWTINTSSRDERFHMHLDPHSITGHGHKHHLKANKPDEFRMFAVRCVSER